MLRLKANPTFRAKAMIPDPGAPAFELDCEFRHMGAKEFEVFRSGGLARSEFDTIKGLLVRWHDETPFSDESLAVMLDTFPGAAAAISVAYAEALYQGRRGN